MCNAMFGWWNNVRRQFYVSIYIYPFVKLAVPPPPSLHYSLPLRSHSISYTLLLVRYYIVHHVWGLILPNEILQFSTDAVSIHSRNARRIISNEWRNAMESERAWNISLALDICCIHTYPIRTIMATYCTCFILLLIFILFLACFHLFFCIVQTICTKFHPHTASIAILLSE